MKAEIWLRIQGKERSWGTERWTLGPVNASKSKPSTNDKEIALKLILEIPNEVFEEPTYEAKFSLPKVTRKLPDVIEIGREVQEALTAKMGFKVKVDMVDPKAEKEKEDA